MDMDKIRLLDERTYWVGDRTISSQIMMFLIAGAITFLIEALGGSNSVITYLWPVFCIILPIVGLVVLIVIRESLYFDHHWHTSFLLMLMTWAPLVIYLGVLIDELLVGHYNAFWMCVFLSLVLGLGYGFAKLLRVKRHSGNVWMMGGIASTIIIVVSIIVGILLYNEAVQAYHFTGIFWEVYQCQGCLFAVYIIIGGIGVVLSMVLYSYMLHCLYDPAGLDVEEDPPNELYLKMMRVSLILCLISYLLLLILIPPIAGGGKGRRGGVPRIRYRRHMVGYGIYASTRNYGKPDEEELKRVEKKWEEVELGKS